MNTGFRNIILIQLGDIGDVVLTTPTIRAVKECYPDARVSILVRKPFGSLLVADPNIHEIVESERYRGSLFFLLRSYVAFARRLRHTHYDLVIDLRTGDRGAILSYLTGAPVRVGRHEDNKPFWHDRLFTKVIFDPETAPPPVHPGADQSLRVVRQLGIDTDDSIPTLYINNADQTRAKMLLAEAGIAAESGLVTINPYSRWKYKEWSTAKWGTVIDRIWDIHRMPAVLIGSDEEASGCQAMVSGREGRVFNLAGKTTLGELAAVISMSTLHLGVDSAAPHIAAAVGTPTVTIHGPTDWRAWRIINKLHQIIIPTNDCVPCNMMGCKGGGQSQCLDELAVGPVVRAVLEILEMAKTHVPTRMDLQ